MTRNNASLALLGICAVLLPGSRVAAARTQSIRSIGLIGFVMDQQGNPLRADVHFLQRDPSIHGWSTRTDAYGSFQVTSADGPLEVRVNADGYTPERAEIVAPATSPLVFHLRRLASIVSAVVDQSGIPVAGAKVIVEEPAVVSRWIATDQEPRFVRTRQDGTFEVFVPGARPFRLIVEKGGCGGWTSEYATVQEGQRVEGQIVRLTCQP